MYLYISPEKTSQMYLAIKHQQLPDSVKFVNATHGEGGLNIGFASAKMDKEKKVESTFPAFLPAYLNELLTTKEMQRLLINIPESIDVVKHSDWIKCQCLMTVTEVDLVNNLVYIAGQISDGVETVISITLSCSYNHFYVGQRNESKASSYSAPFVHKKISLNLETVFVVLKVEKEKNTHYILGSPLYIALPINKLPWQKQRKY